jgi:hypothetical protein
MADDPTYVATEDLYASGPGVMPQLMYRAGDRVPARVLDKRPDWRAKVRDAARGAVRSAAREAAASRAPAPGKPAHRAEPKPPPS